MRVRVEIRQAIDTENPAKPLLLLIGGLYVLVSPQTFLSGLQAGYHLIVGSLFMFVLGSGTIWLAFRSYSIGCRRISIIWGLFLFLFFLYLTVATFDVNGLGFYAFVLMIATPIPVLAFLQKPVDLQRE